MLSQGKEDKAKGPLRGWLGSTPLSLPLFQPVKDAGKIGIPCIVTPEGTVSLDWEQYVKSGDA